MTNAVTNKTMVLVSKLGDFWITDERAKRIMAIRESQPESTIELDGNYISGRSIDGVLTAQSYEDLNHRRHGDWQCKSHYWHERFESCDHDNALKRAFRGYNSNATP